jgi:hypothetical protein
VKLQRQHLTMAIASGVLVASLAAGPMAFAQHGSDDTTQPPTTATETEPNHQTTVGTNTTATETEHTAGDDSLQTSARNLLQAERQKGKQHTTAQRKQACVAHQAEINRREANYAKAAQRHLDTFTNIFTKVQAFQTSKQLTVTNYDTLVATANQKKAAAQRHLMSK